VSVGRVLSDGEPEARHDEALHRIAGRIAARREALARQMQERLSAEADNGGLTDPVDPDAAAEDRMDLAREEVDAFVAALRGTEPLTVAQTDRIRETSARLAHERLSLEFLMHFTRVCSGVLWDAVIAGARLGHPAEREAAIAAASRLLAQVDRFSRVATNAYLDEVTDRGLLRRDLLDSLVSGRADEEGIRRLARSLKLKLGESYVVIVVRGEELHGEVGREEPLASRVNFDRMVGTVRARLRPVAGSLLVGIRDGDLVVLYPVSGPGEQDDVKRACVELAEALSIGVSLGLSTCHRGLRSLATAHAEARGAASIASRAGIRGRAVCIDDVIVDQMLCTTPYVQRILERTLRSLEDYDRAHGTDLMATLQAYVRTRLNLTKAAEVLNIHPNTVVYRLRRMRELSGRDPHQVDDLVMLWLALKARELQLPAPVEPLG
jgi:sugar diacid utilization regulator